MPDRVTSRDVYDEVKKINEILTGNGDPSKGMIVKQALMNQKLDALSDNVKWNTERIGDLDKKISAHTGFNGTERRNLFGLISPETQATLWKYTIRAGMLFLMGDEIYRNVIEKILR